MIYLDSLRCVNAWPMDLYSHDDCTQDSAFAIAEYRYARTLSGSVRDSNYIPRGEARPESCWSTIPVLSDPDLPWTVPVHCRSITWKQLLAEPDRVTVMVAVHKELDIDTACGSQYDNYKG